MHVTVIGAGLAGSECAWQLAQRGVSVTLYEMKPQKFSPAHHSTGLAELICSNSLKAKRTESAAGLLKTEMRRFGSLCMECADLCEVPAGGALAVDRDEFSRLITEKITSHKNNESTNVPSISKIAAFIFIYKTVPFPQMFSSLLIRIKSPQSSIRQNSGRSERLLFGV